MWGHWYWPTGLTACALILGIPELIGLITNVRNTLSWWLWTQFHIAHVQGFSSWNAGLFFLFGFWILFVVWLTLHIFFHLFA